LVLAASLGANFAIAADPIVETDPSSAASPTAREGAGSVTPRGAIKAPTANVAGEAALIANPPPSSPAAASGAASASGGSGAKAAGKQAQKFSLLDPKSWPFSLIPIPEIATDPNGGTTVGVLPVFLFNNDQHQITDILAPDIYDNTNVGAGGHFRWLSYPSPDTQYYVIAGAAQNIARGVDVFYSTGRQHDRRWSLDLRFFYEKDPTERFFGIGNNTSESGQSNYTTKQVYGESKIGLNITPNLQLQWMERPKWVRIQRGALGPQIPFIGTLYPTVKGLQGGTEMMNRLMLAYDDRDSPDIPRKGGLYRLFAGISDRRFLSSSSYSQLGADARNYLPIGSRVTLASHAYLQYTPAGVETPFWAMARLGGEDSLLTDQQTLRGYGAGRFVDNNVFVFNLEARTRVYERNLFDTHGVVELAPFFEAGDVFHDFDDNPINHLHPVGGIGFRGIAEPFVVGYVDVGFGGEGSSIFSGVNYPF
jgi:hypothetical protein